MGTFKVKHIVTKGKREKNRKRLNYSYLHLIFFARKLRILPLYRPAGSCFLPHCPGSSFPRKRATGW